MECVSRNIGELEGERETFGGGEFLPCLVFYDPCFAKTLVSATKHLLALSDLHVSPTVHVLQELLLSVWQDLVLEVVPLLVVSIVAVVNSNS